MSKKSNRQQKRHDQKLKQRKAKNKIKKEQARIERSPIIQKKRIARFNQQVQQSYKGLSWYERFIIRVKSWKR